MTIRLQIATLGAMLWFRVEGETAERRPSYMVAVPERAFSANTRWKNILEGSQVAYAIETGIQIARSF